MHELCRGSLLLGGTTTNSTNYYDESADTRIVGDTGSTSLTPTAAPDGVERVVLSVNGTVPGPTIIADWGDTISESATLITSSFVCLFLPSSKQNANSSQ